MKASDLEHVIIRGQMYFIDVNSVMRAQFLEYCISRKTVFQDLYM